MADVATGLETLANYLKRLPTVTFVATSGSNDDPELASIIDDDPELAELLDEESGGSARADLWWVKLGLDIHDHMAWHVVQELGFVLNYVSLTERLPTVFKPVSPAPYMNGGPDGFLAWVIEATQPGVDPDQIRKWLESRLPTPPSSLVEWERCLDPRCTIPSDD